MIRKNKFRAWDEEEKRMCYGIDGDDDPYWRDGDCFGHVEMVNLELSNCYYIWEQSTGLLDKNGKEIYENCELDGRYRVEYIAPKFVGKDMIKGDIIELYDNKFTITKEHCEISQNSERGIN